MKEERSEEKEQRRPLLFRLLFFKIRIPFDFILLIIGLTVIGTAYIMVKVPQLSMLINPHIVTQNEIGSLIDDVSRLISLPEDEKPFVVTVYNASEILDQPLFEKAQDGDKLLLYTKNHKAILYRPSENIIIEVGKVMVEK